MSNTPNDPTTPNGQTVGDLTPPDDFGADLAAIFAARETRAFDPNASRGDLGVGGEVPGGPVAAMGNERDADLVPPGGWPGGESIDVTQTAPAEPVAAPATSDLPPPEGLPAPTPEASVPAVDGQPGDGTAPAPPEPPVSGGAEPTVEPAAEPPVESPDGYVYTYTNEQGVEASIKFTNEQVERALSVAAWADALPDHTRQAMGAIEEGQAVAIPRVDYDRYLAWQNQQQRTQRDADLVNYDEDAAREIQRLRDENAQLTGQPQQQPQQQQVPANVDANLTRTAQEYDAACRAFQAQHQLSDQERDQLLDAISDAQIIAGLQQAHTQFNPVTGQVIRVDGYGAMMKALNAALTWNPQLHNKVLASQQSQSTPTPPAVPQPDPVTTKKANAASLASAPSAAVPPAPRTQALTGQEAVNAMAQELLAFMNK